MQDKEIKTFLKQGWIRTIATFEVVGKPKEHVEAALTQYLDNIQKDDRIKTVAQEREPATALEDGLYSTFAECEIMVKDLGTLTWICINFSPASIEILEPAELRFKESDLTNWLNDLLARLHDLSTDYRNQKAGKDHMVLALNTLIQNSVLLALKSGEKTAKELEEETGVLGDQMTPFLDHLIEKGKIVHVGKKYRRA